MNAEQRMELFTLLIRNKKTRSYGFCHVDRPSKFWPDQEVCHFEEIAHWKNDLRKEQRGGVEFEGHWGMGTNFENPMDIEMLLTAFKSI